MTTVRHAIRATALVACVCALVAATLFTPLAFDANEILLDGIKLEAQLVDVTGDGVADLTLNQVYVPSHLVVYPGNGDGTFGAALPSYPLMFVWTVSLGDVNADGLADLIEVEGSGSGITVHLGQGDGTFVPAGHYATTTDPNEAILADLDNDGFLDLVIPAGEGITCCGLTTWLGNGDGTFHTPWSILAGAFPGGGLSSLRPIDSGDLDGDGLLDLVVTEYAGDMFQLKGRGDGTFDPPMTMNPTGPNYSGADLGDLDNDGDLDVVSRRQGGQLAAFLNDSHGGFSAPVLSSQGGIAKWHRPLGDFDLDGWLDVASYADAPFIASGRGDGTFSDPRPPDTPSGGMRWITGGDVDGGGLPDLAVVLDTPSRAIVLRNTGDGPVLPAVGLGFAGGAIPPRLVGVGDLSPGSTLELRLSCTAPGAGATLVIGTSSPLLPFKGGVLVPSPDLLVGGLPVGPEGELVLPLPWPPGIPTGRSVWMQFWLQDAGAPHGFSASNGVRATQR